MKNVYLLPTNPNDETKKGIWIKETRDWANIYITSDEEIKTLEYEIYNNKVLKKVGNATSYGKKIILTTDQDLIKDGVQAIDDEFLEWFVNNPSCEFVDVGIEGYKKNGMIDESTSYKYKITISKEEQKQHLIDIMRGDEELGLYDEQPKQDYNGVHLRHCYQGEYEDGCKYGEDDCPAKPKEEPNKTHYLDELPNMDREVLAKMWKSAIPKLSSKQETTLEEREPYWDLVDAKAEQNNRIDLDAYANGVLDGVKWMQERSYSETEVLQLLLKLQQTESYDNLYDWFEQVKKN